MEKNVYAQMYVEQYKEKLTNVLEQLSFYSDGFCVECRMDENILLKGINESRLKAYQLRENILEIKEGSYTKKELKKIERGILGYYFDREKDLRKQFLKAIKETDAITVNKNESIVNMDTVKAMILIGLLD